MVGIENLPGYGEARQPADGLQRDLSDLAKRHGLQGVILIQFGRERVGCRSWGGADAMARQMDAIGSRVLKDIAAGRHDLLENTPAQGRA